MHNGNQATFTHLIGPSHGDEGRVFVLVFWEGRPASSLSLTTPLEEKHKSQIQL